MATVDVIKRLFAAYPSQSVSEATVVVYLAMLQDIPADTLAIVVGQCIAECKWLPTVSELRDKYLSLVTPAQRTPGEAWGSVERAIRYVGHVATPTFTDPITAQVVKQMGWRNICMSDKIAVERAQFIKMYETLVARTTAQTRLLPAARSLAEKHNALLPISAFLQISTNQTARDQ